MLNSVMSAETKADKSFAAEMYSVSHAIANALVVRRLFSQKEDIFKFNFTVLNFFLYQSRMEKSNHQNFYR